MTADPRAVGLSEAALTGLRQALSNEFELRDEVGRGSSAVVFRALDLKLRRPVAIKVLRPDVIPESGRARFGREIAVVAALSHPHIVALYASGEAGGLLYYVMPLVEGESLRDRLRRERQLPLDEALRLTRDVASALQYAHEHGLVHRDVKPENMLITGGSVASLGDFGLARMLEDDDGRPLTLSGVAVGTAAYMSPEQASGDVVDARTDQYALACVLYEMLAGVPPFHAATIQGMLARHRSDPPPRLRLTRETVPQGIEDVLLKALAKLPADRYTTVTEFVRALEGALTADTLAVVRGPARRASMTDWMRAQRVPIAVAAVGMAVVLVFAANATRQPAVPVDTNRIAVAPFDVFDPADSVWRFGMVEVLSRNLDGAGPLRAVPPSVVTRGWSGSADLISVSGLTRRTGSGLALFGQLLPVGTNTLRLRATLRDVLQDRTVREFEITDDRARVPQIADSITMLVLRELTQTRAIASVRQASFLSSNLSALRAFLQGEQYYRANDFTRAQGFYELALAADSNFAVAYRRMRGVLRATTGSETDSLSFWYALRAGERNQKQSQRDSLLLVADSIAATFSGSLAFREPSEQRMGRRRFNALERAAQLYPDDPEVWMELAEARYHAGDVVGATREGALVASENAIRRDPDFAPPYFHAIELALAHRGIDSARMLIRAYRVINPADRRLQLAEEFLKTGERAASAISAVPADTLLGTAYLLTALPGRKARMAEGIYRHLLARADLEPGQRSRTRELLILLLISAGRIGDAVAVLGNSESRNAPYIAYPLGVLGSADPIRTDSVFSSFQQSTSRTRRLYALAWFGVRRDTVALRRFELDHTSKGNAGTAITQYLATAGRAYIALAVGDRTTAVRLFASLPDSLCGVICLPQRLAYANELFALDDLKTNSTYLKGWSPPDGVMQVERYRWMMLRARIAERGGETTSALAGYASLTARLEEAEGSLGSIRTEAAAGQARLRRGKQ